MNPAATPRDSSEPQYWFRAKRYGWGWGLPSSRNGWVFFVAWSVVLMGGLLVLHSHHPLARVAWFALLGLVLVIVCYAKGEPPSWRWGDGD